MQPDEAQGPYAERPQEPPAQPQRPKLPPTPATFVLLGLIIVIYLISLLLSGSFFGPEIGALVLLGAKVNELIAAGEFWRLLTATFLHASLIHIFFNGYALYALGPETERIYGTARFLVLYFIAGLGGSIASYLLSRSISVGASGAIFGLIGGLTVFYYLNRAVLGEFGRMQVQNMIGVAAINLFIGFAAPGIIDNWGHLGGLVGGAAAGLALAPRLRVDAHHYPPRLVRQQFSMEWAGVAAVVLVMAALTLMLPPAS